jgi:hypothetical protein
LNGENWVKASGALPLVRTLETHLLRPLTLST